MSNDAITPAETNLPASEIKLQQFRMILQWPLVLDSSTVSRDGKNSSSDSWIANEIDKVKKVLKESEWEIVSDVRNYPPSLEEGQDKDGGGYAQCNYFHDFVQKFIFSNDNENGFEVFERTDVVKIKTNVRSKDFQAKVERLSLHVFDIGVSMMTLELDWSLPNKEEKLSLANAQDLIDHFRRTYTPFWIGDAAQRVPLTTELVYKADQAHNSISKPYSKDSVLADMKATGHAKVFKHWEELLAPLQFPGEGGHWRDPSDERMPINTYIALDCDDEEERKSLEALSGHDYSKKSETISSLYSEMARKSKKVLESLSENDWIRLADAEESGTGCPYNPQFIRTKMNDKYYDRFNTGKDSAFTTRHIIDAAHYCVVGSGGFFEDLIVHHFRRHYSWLSMIARFEFAVLLSISSRLSDAANRFRAKEQKQEYEDDILNIQKDFVGFMHRYRFTGVSSQLQPREMFAMWRKELGLDVMFEDVRSEIDVAFQRVTALQQKRETEAASSLNKIALIGVVLGLIAGFMGANIFVDANKPHLSQFLAIVCSVFVSLGFGVYVLRIKLDPKSSRGLNAATGIGLFGLLALAIISYLNGGMIAALIEDIVGWFCILGEAREG